jgi:hypothetical protein
MIKGGTLVSFRAIAYQEGAVAHLGALAPEPSLRQPYRFCAFAHGDSRFFWASSPFCFAKEKHVRYMWCVMQISFVPLFWFNSDSEVI